MMTDVHALVAPALDVYGTEIARHLVETPNVVADTTYGLSHVSSQRYVGVCRCGWTAPRAQMKRGDANRSAGLHAAAACRRTSKAYDVEVARLIEGGRRTVQDT